jgi:hypothetical protein
VSPFIVTTSQPGCSACGQELELRDEPDTTIVLSRMAVATLEEAQRAVHDADEIGTVEDLLYDLAQAVMYDDPQLHWDRDRGLIYQRAWNRLISESGGTVGPLPDGTTIKVEPLPWFRLAIVAIAADMLPAWQQGADTPWVEKTKAEIIAAFNAKHGPGPSKCGSSSHAERGAVGPTNPKPEGGES